MIFIKLKINIIPNYIFLSLLVILLLINELYNYKPNKEKFNPYIYDGSYDKYFKKKIYLHQSDTELNNLGKLCNIDKSLAIKNIQDGKLKTYKDFLKKMDNVVYGNENPDDLKIPENLHNIEKEEEEIDKIKEIICPPVCHLIENVNDCNNAVDYKEVLENIDKVHTTAPVFNDKRMLREAYECLKLENDECDQNKNCTREGDICIYDKKKCEYDNDKEVCRQKCNIFEEKSSCPADYCNWNNTELKCENKS